MLKLKATLLYFNKPDIDGKIFKLKNIDLTNILSNSSQYNLFGELGQPDTFDISLSKVSHCFTKIYIDNNRLIGHLDIVDTDIGKVLNEIIKTTLSLKKDSNYNDIQKIKFYRLLKLSKSIQTIDLDLYNCGIVFRMRYKGKVNDNNEVIVKDVYTFDAITNKEDNFKNIIK